ncbi:uncharacterized protein LOC124844520 [Vigna umbellata]|uniref:uncharacterized protein LOC124844520 n=1 Tax=Vigna umbellata TaxID=87088 RepID=UPI001F5FCEC3|nr:uncharacterized protein LOC124844520 [Vigna umbellata]
MAFQYGVVAFLPFLLSFVLLHRHFPSSVISAQSHNLTSRQHTVNESRKLNESDTQQAQPPSDTQNENVLQNSDSEIQMIQSVRPPTSLVSPPTQTQKNVSSNSNVEVNIGNKLILPILQL